MTTTGSATVAPMIQVIKVWDRIRAATAAGAAPTDAERRALVGLLDEIMLAIDTVARLQRDDPGCATAVEGIMWQRVATAFTDLLTAGTTR